MSMLTREVTPVKPAVGEPAVAAPYAAHLAKLAAIETAEAAIRREAHARDAALGPTEGPCCQPHEEPCVTCLVPDDVPYEPSPEDEEWYRGLCRERNDRLFAERIAADDDRAFRDQMRAEADARLAAAVFAAAQAGTFQEMLDGLCNAFSDHDESAEVRLVGGVIGAAADLARHLEAKSAEQFIDRKECMLDAEVARVEARMAAHAGR